MNGKPKRGTQLSPTRERRTAAAPEHAAWSAVDLDERRSRVAAAVDAIEIDRQLRAAGPRAPLLEPVDNIASWNCPTSVGGDLLVQAVTVGREAPEERFYGNLTSCLLDPTG